MAKVKTKKKTASKKGDAEGPKGKEMDFRIDDLSFAPEMQPRAGDGTSGHGLYADHVEDVRAAVRKREPLPRIRIWRVAGKGNIVTDGHHVTEAYRLEGRKTVPAEVFEGEWWQAVLDASGANAHEGAAKKLSHAEKRTAVKNAIKALKDSGQNWSNVRIAKHCRVSDDLVASVMGKSPELKPTGPVSGTDGKKYPQENRGKKKPAVKAEPVPEPKADVKPLDPIAAAVVARAVEEHKAEPAFTRESPRTFDFAAFESKWGQLAREIDNLAAVFHVMNTARTEGIRKHLGQFKAAFTEWHRELGEKARTR